MVCALSAQIINLLICPSCSVRSEYKQIVEKLRQKRRNYLHHHTSEKIRNRLYLSQSFTLHTRSKSLPWEQLGIPLKHFSSFLLPCILVTVIVTHHITSRYHCVAGCDCLDISLFIFNTLLSVYSSPLAEKKKLIYQNNGM